MHIQVGATGQVVVRLRGAEGREEMLGLGADRHELAHSRLARLVPLEGFAKGPLGGGIWNLGAKGGETNRLIICNPVTR